MPNRPTYTEATRTIPVRDEVDVLVAGGGLAGVSAAAAAARDGALPRAVDLAAVQAELVRQGVALG